MIWSYWNKKNAFCKNLRNKNNIHCELQTELKVSKEIFYNKALSLFAAVLNISNNLLSMHDKNFRLGNYSTYVQ